jgi:hypothetical protein
MKTVCGRFTRSIILMAGVILFANYAIAQCRKPDFSEPVSSQALNTIGVLTVGDFNNDGRQDLVMSGANDFRLSIMLGSGDGTFGSSSLILSPEPAGNGNTPEVVTAGDINNDGNLDLVVSHRVGLSIDILQGRGDGAFSNSGSIQLSKGKIDSLTLRDLNNDGNADLVATIPPDLTERKGLVVIAINLGNAAFGEAVYYNPDPDNINGRTSTRMLGVTDISGDGRTDLILSTSDISSNNQSIRIVEGQGNGAFNFKVDAVVKFPVNTVVGLYDANADNRLDIVAIYSDNKKASVQLGHGDGTFDNPLVSSLHEQSNKKLDLFDVRDFNIDGKPDLAIKNIEIEDGIWITRGISIYIGKGNGTFASSVKLNYQEPTYSLSGGVTQGLVVADFDGDGRADLASGNYMSNNVTVRLNSGCSGKANIARASGASSRQIWIPKKSTDELIP